MADRRKFLKLGAAATLLALFWNLGAPGIALSESDDLADQINASLGEVSNWNDSVDIGVVMHKSSPSDFNIWISDKANNSDWKGVFNVRRHAEQAGYHSSTIDNKVKLALSKIPMFNKYSLPKTDSKDDGYFWPWDRYVLYGYKYAEELDWETRRWDKDSGFSALKSVRDWYGRAFCQANPDIPTAMDLFGTRWHQVGCLIDCFLIFHKLGVKDALNYAVQEWKWLNNNLWSNYYFNYAPAWRGWEFSGMTVFPIVMKLHREGTAIDNRDRVVTDLQYRYIGSSWDSPQWGINHRVAEHHNPGNNEQRLDGTSAGWIMLNTFYSLFNYQNQTNMKNMLEGNAVTQAWKGLSASELRQAKRHSFRITNYHDYEDRATACAALTLFLLGISPQIGRGLAVPLISDRASSCDSLNLRHFEFDYESHKIKIPVWGGTTLKFMYGSTPVSEYFKTTGIYDIAFAADWNSILQSKKLSNLCSNQSYLWGHAEDTWITIMSNQLWD